VKQTGHVTVFSDRAACRDASMFVHSSADHTCTDLVLFSFVVFPLASRIYCVIQMAQLWHRYRACRLVLDWYHRAFLVRASQAEWWLFSCEKL